MTLTELALFVVSFLFGGFAGYLLFRFKGTGTLNARLSLLQEQLDSQTAKNDTLYNDVQTWREKATRLETEKEGLIENQRQHKNDLAEMEKKFSLQFENLANRIFDEKSTAFKKESKEGIEQLLTPLKERLKDFEKKVDDSFAQHGKEQVSLKTQIEHIVNVNREMTQQAESLTKALKGDVKAQGNWGEIILEKILEDSGLIKNRDYIVQGTDMKLRDSETGRVQKPDVVIMLPENKHVIVDSKVSLTHYERYCAEQDESLRAKHLKEYLNSIRAHVKGLEDRRYQDTEKLGTPDFVLMFMPIEGAYSLAMQQDPELHAYAWDKKIVIVCPTTLFATLRTIHSVWRIETQNRYTLKIAEEGGKLYDKIAGFVEDMQKIGHQINTTQETYHKAFDKLSTGRGNILKRTEDLRALGVKAKKQLPADLVDSDEDDDDLDEKGDTVTKLAGKG